MLDSKAIDRASPLHRFGVGVRAALNLRRSNTASALIFEWQDPLPHSMNIIERYIKSAYRKGWIILGLVMFALSSALTVTDDVDASAFLVGLPLLIGGVIAIIGRVQVVRGRTATKDFKFLFALVVNVGMTVLLTSMIVANLVDLARAF